MTTDLRSRLAIPADRIATLNAFLLDPDGRLLGDLLAIVARYGTPEAINEKARAAGALPALLERVRTTRPEYAADLEWLAEQRDAGAFVTVADYRRSVLGGRADEVDFREELAVALEISSLQYFPWVIASARRACAPISPGPSAACRPRLTIS